MSIESILAKSKQYISMLHIHRMTVYTWQNVKQPDGSVKPMLVPDPAITDTPCHLSKNSNSIYANPNKEESTYQIVDGYPKVFCDPAVPIKAGDIVWITVGTKVYKGKAGDDFAYKDNHLEFSFGIEMAA